MKKIQLLLVLLFSISSHAQTEEKFKLNLGVMFVTNFETQMQLSPKNLPLGANISTKDQLGMENDTEVFRFDALYRFNEAHSINISYFSVRSNGLKVIDKEIVWNDNTIAAGATVNSYFNMDIYKLNYNYSFYHNEKVELSLSVGLHITGIDTGLHASGVVNSNPNNNYSESSGATVPLPVFGFKGEYTIIEKRFFVNYSADYFFLEYDNYGGTLVSSSLALEYRFIDSLALGLGYNTNRLQLTAENENTKLAVKNTLSGTLLYISYIY